MKSVALPSGIRVPAAGLGTWTTGEKPLARADEVAALRRGIDLGMTLIDTAEMYAEGGAEEVVGEAIGGQRDRVFLVSKVYPHNATRSGVAQACERSLRRLRTDRIDLYLLHWRGSVPLAETLEGFSRLRDSGKIAGYGVSNFDPSDMSQAWGLPGGPEIATDQILYNLSRRGPELELIPWCRSRRVPVMAYSPVEQGRLLKNAALKRIAKNRGVTAAQVALAWLLLQDQMIVIPKSSTLGHVEENRAAADLTLEAEDLQALEAAFPRPVKPGPLETL